jgi:hypothetical protein
MANMTFHLGLSAFFLIAKLKFSTPQGLVQRASTEG